MRTRALPEVNGKSDRRRPGGVRLRPSIVPPGTDVLPAGATCRPTTANRSCGRTLAAARPTDRRERRAAGRCPARPCLAQRPPRRRRPGSIHFGPGGGHVLQGPIPRNETSIRSSSDPVPEAARSPGDALVRRAACRRRRRHGAARWQRRSAREDARARHRSPRTTAPRRPVRASVASEAMPWPVVGRVRRRLSARSVAARQAAAACRCPPARRPASANSANVSVGVMSRVRSIIRTGPAGGRRSPARCRCPPSAPSVPVPARPCPDAREAGRSQRRFGRRQVNSA